MVNANNNKIKFLSWNSNSIKNKFMELANYIYLNKIDVIGLNETKLDKNIKLQIPGYSIYRNDRNCNGGGVAILVKKSIQHYYVPLNLENIEAVAICISTTIGEIKIISAYLPPDKSLLINDLVKIKNHTGPFILMGDLNARNTAWNCITSNSKGKVLVDYCTKNNIQLLTPEKPTHFPKRGLPSIIDMFLLKNIYEFTEANSLPILSSDHNPIYMEVFLNNNNKKMSYHLEFKKANWNLFNKIVNERLNPNFHLENSADIELHLNKFNSVVNEAILKSVPRVKSDFNSYILPCYISKLIEVKNSYRRNFQRTGNSESKTIMYILMSEIKEKINKWKNSKWQKTLKNAKPGDNSLWKLVKKRKKGNSHIAPLITKNGYVFSDLDKANEIADELSKVYSMNENLGNISHQKTVVREARKFMKVKDVVNFKHTTPCEIKNVIRSFKNNKAPGTDGITYLILKKLPKKGIVYLTKISNSIMDLGFFPDQWKTSKTIVILKKNKNPALALSYRPISLLDHTSKVVEKIIGKRIDEFTHQNNILINEQFGFRMNHNTVQQIARFTNQITKEFNNKKHTGAVFLDMEKAFDTVWHFGLIYKLINYNFPKYLIKIISSYLSNRKMNVHYNKVISSTKHVTAGVPQGSILGPKLFLLYINDIPRNKNTSLAIFADDSALFTSSYRIDTIINRLEKTSLKIIKFFTKWKLKNNKEKTEAIIFTRRRPIINSCINIENYEIKWSTQVKYLGITLDERLTYSAHINNIVNKCTGLLIMLYPLINRNSKLSVENKLLIYKSIIRPVISYGCPVWSNISESNFNKVQILQNKFLRLIGNYPRYTWINKMHVELKIEFIKSYIIKLTKNFFDQIEKSNNVINELNYINIKYKHRRIKHVILN